MTNRIEEMKADTDVLAHIRKINAAAKKEMEETPGLWVGMLGESLASEYETVYDFERAMGLEAYHNAHKAEHGVRPRVDAGASLEDIQRDLDAL